MGRGISFEITHIILTSLQSLHFYFSPLLFLDCTRYAHLKPVVNVRDYDTVIVMYIMYIHLLQSIKTDYTVIINA